MLKVKVHKIKYIIQHPLCFEKSKIKINCMHYQNSGGGQDGCERRIEVFVKSQKKNWGGGGGGGEGWEGSGWM